jgi:ankyrin repeat protein
MGRDLNNQQLFNKMCTLGQLDMVKYLASLLEVDATADDNRAIRQAIHYASIYGHEEVVTFLQSLGCKL